MNSLMMYGRMVIVMIITLYTSRIVLRSLGVEDYGIYNLVGGLVVFFTVINAAMLSATQRFLNYGLGKGEEEKLGQIFKTAVLIHLMIAGIIIILAETAGLWLLTAKLKIPPEKDFAAMVVYQLSIVTVVIQIATLPYNAVIAAHEKISVIAMVSVAMAVLNLGAAMFLWLVPSSRLEYYTLFILGVQVIICGFYVVYSKSKFAETSAHFRFDKAIFKEMTIFSGWCLVGTSAGILYTQGLNILLGMFFLPFVNAARGIAVTVQNAMNQIFNNVQTAVVPQLIQSYARNDMEYFYSLIFKSSKYFSFLLLIVAIPLFIRMPYVLGLWLGEVPEYSVIFTRILLGVSLIDAISASLMRASDATGNIKKYHLVVGGVLLTIVPVAYLWLKLGGSPQTVFYTYLTISVVALAARLWILRERIELPVKSFCIRVLLRIILVLAVGFPICHFMSGYMPDSFWGTLSFFLISFLIITATVWVLGTEKKERQMATSKIASLLHR